MPHSMEPIFRHVLDLVSDWTSERDFGSAVVAVVLLGWCGAVVVKEHPRLKTTGLVCGTTTVVAWFVVGWIQNEIELPADLLTWACWSLIAGGLVTSLVWLSLPLIAMAAWLIHTVGRLLVRGVTGALSAVGSVVRHARNAWHGLRAERQVRAAVAIADQEERDANRVARRLAVVRHQLRLQCEVAYNARAPQIAQQLPRQAFENLLATYLSDQMTRRQLERHAEMVLGLLQLYGADPETNSELTLTELGAFFDRQAQELQQAGLDPETRDSILSDLNQRRLEAIEEYWNHVSRRNRH